MARIVVTGSDGGLGRAWVRRLADPDLSLAPALPGPVEVIALPRARLDVAALNIANQVLDEVRPDVVLNCAGRTSLEGCEAAQWEAFRVNRDGADHVARACARLGALPVYFSTSLVFDGAKLQPYVEEDPPNPLSKYGESKLAGELRTAGAAHRHLIVRSGWIYGQPGRHFLKPLQGDEPFDVLDAQIGQATWVRDFMEAVLFLLRSGKTGRWHAASPGAVSQERAVREARLRLGGGGPPAHPKVSRARVPESAVLDVAKLEAAGHAMRRWEDGLEAYIKTISNH